MFGQIDSTFSSGLAGHLAASKTSTDSASASLQEAAAQVKDAARQLAAAASGAAAATLGGRAGGGTVSLAELEARKDPKNIISGVPTTHNVPLLLSLVGGKRKLSFLLPV